MAGTTITWRDAPDILCHSGGLLLSRQLCWLGCYLLFATASDGSCEGHLPSLCVARHSWKPSCYSHSPFRFTESSQHHPCVLATPPRRWCCSPSRHLRTLAAWWCLRRALGSSVWLLVSALFRLWRTWNLGLDWQGESFCCAEHHHPPLQSVKDCTGIHRTLVDPLLKPLVVPPDPPHLQKPVSTPFFGFFFWIFLFFFLLS